MTTVLQRLITASQRPPAGLRAPVKTAVQCWQSVSVAGFGHPISVVVEQATKLQTNALSVGY